MINTAAILAAGLGSRIKESHGDRPKGFIQIDSVPIIERSIDILKSHGISNIFIGTGHHSEHYERLASTRSLHCIKNPDYENTGSFYTLTNMKNELNTDFLLLESDLIYEARAITRIIENSQPNVILASGETNSGDEVFI